MKNKYPHFLKVALFIVISTTSLASNDFDQLRPDDVGDKQWASLKIAVQETKLLPEPVGIGGGDDQFGYAVSIDGNRALVGGPHLNTTGAVLVLEFDGVDWSEVATLLASDGTQYDQFGVSVSLVGNRALIGSIKVDGISGADAAAYIFDFDGFNWVESQKLTPVDGDRSDLFGISVSLSGDRAVVGSIEEGLQNGPGSVYVFDYNGSNWMQSQKLKAADGDLNDQFGIAVSLMDNWLLIGASGDDDNGSKSGSVYVFEYDGIGWSERQKITASDGVASDQFGVSVSLSDGRALVGASGAGAYLVEYDGVNWTLGQKLTTTFGSVNDHFGYAVSLDGDRAVVGSYGADDNGNDSGAAFVFDYDGLTWSQSQMLTANDGTAGDQLGFALGISEDHIMLGANLDGVNAIDSGAVYAYSYIGASWGQSQKISVTEGAFGDHFGSSVSLSGNIALVGVPGDDDNGSNAGATYVFEHDGIDWVLSQKIMASDGVAGDQFGFSVNLFGDRAFVGAVGVDDNGSDSGAVYVLEFDGVNWNQGQKLIANDWAFNYQFGNAISSFGDRVLVGAYGANDFGYLSGAAYVFDYDGTIWTESQKLTGSLADQYDRFGVSVSLAEDRMMVGAYGDDSRGAGAGTVYVFDYDGVAWIQSQKLVADDASQSDAFGFSVSLYGDRALIGASGTDNNGPQTGSVYAFDFNGSSWDQSQKISLGFSMLPRYFGTSVSLTGDYALVGAREDTGNNSRSGAAYVYEYDGNSWTLNQKIIANDGNINDGFGHSVSISGDYVLVGAYRDDDRGSDSGSAYLFNLNPQYELSVSVTGLAGGTLNLSNGGDNLAINVDGTQTLSVLTDGSSFDVDITAQPTMPSQVCGFTSDDSGSINGLNITVFIDCEISQYFIGGYAENLIPGNNLLLQNNDSDDLVVSLDGVFVFSTPLDDLQNYAVTIQNQPTNPIQLCAISNNIGNLNGDDVDDVFVSCEFGDDLIYRHGFDTPDGISQIRLEPLK